MARKEEQVSPEIASRIAGLSDGAKMAIVLVANAFRFGGNWAFIRESKPDYMSSLELLKSERPNVQIFKVSNGALIHINENFLAHNINAVIPEAINVDFAKKAQKRRFDERQRFEKFIESVFAGKSRYVKDKKGYYELVVAVNSVNDTNAIRLNGVNYPAYKLTLVEALDMAVRAAKAKGREVYTLGINKEGERVFDNAWSLMTNSKGLAAVYRGLEISETDTGVFLTLRFK